MSFFVLVGFFALANRDVGAFSFFDTSIMCAGNLAPVPWIFVTSAPWTTLSPSSPQKSQTNTEDFVLDTVDINVFRGDPHSPTYEDHVPAARSPNSSDVDISWIRFDLGLIRATVVA
jgi:hypothetical protein